MSQENRTPKYTPSAIEPAWQTRWFDESNAFVANVDPSKKPYYVLEMLPYPSGQLHMGHVRNYTMGDVLARFKRAAGFNVMHPMGWDSFGLPAENAAIKRKTHPQTWTLSNIADMKKVMRMFGWSYDWSKEVTTCLPDYYGHQQALFLDFYQKGLVYRKESLVNWDPVDHTVLANEQVVDGKGWRSGVPVERKLLAQWFMRITAYAEQLNDDIAKLEGWPERVRIMQQNWLGKSTGLSFEFKVNGLPESSTSSAENTLSVFTTRPDTLYGATFCCVAPEHPLAKLAAASDASIQAFVTEAAALGTAQEVIDKAEKKGIKLPYTAVHPLTGAQLPIYAANFVLMSYGTGAIMSVPAHDERDHAFAKKYHLPIVQVIQHPQTPVSVDEQAFTDDGILVNSPLFEGQTVAQAQANLIAKAEKEGWGQGVTQWRIRDWGISRQRYWGCPIPFIHCQTCGVQPVPRESLPVTLPTDVDFTGSGNPLENHPTWKHTTCPCCGAAAVRETDTMDTFMDSSWYYLRYLCPTADKPLDEKTVSYWMGTHGVDQYIGGIEHAVLHLLYSRFFTKALRDCGYFGNAATEELLAEPFKRLLCQGMVIGNSYLKADGTYLYPSQIRWDGTDAFDKETGEKVKVLPAEKISKSKNNGDSPDALVAKFGADTLRLFILFTAPPERDLEWSEAAIDGAWRFLNRVWTLAWRANSVPANATWQWDSLTDAQKALVRKTHQTIRKVTADIESFSYNTMVAAIMELSNTLGAVTDDTLAADATTAAVFRDGVMALVHLLNPSCPHLTEELWQNAFGQTKALHATPWLAYHADFAKDDEILLVVQVNGKLRAKLTVPADISAADAIALAKTAPEAQSWIAGKALVKELYVPGRLVNLVVKD